MNLTRKQLHEACKKNRYIAIRWTDGLLTAINCRIVNHSRFNNISKGNQSTNFIGFYPCSFQEYISLKTPFYGKIQESKN